MILGRRVVSLLLLLRVGFVCLCTALLHMLVCVSACEGDGGSFLGAQPVVHGYSLESVLKGCGVNPTVNRNLPTQHSPWTLVCPLGYLCACVARTCAFCWPHDKA